MKVIMFKPQFHQAIIEGKKTRTIRPVRENPINKGDELSLRGWEDRPYNSPQFELKHVTCKEITPIIINEDYVIFSSERYDFPSEKIDKFAQLDGLKNFKEMRAWFKKKHTKNYHLLVFVSNGSNNE